MFYVYVIKSKKDGLCYTGSTPDLRKRFLEHNKGLVRSTSPRRPFTLVYYEAYRAEKDARLRESRLKEFKRAYNQLRQRIANSLSETSWWGSPLHGLLLLFLFFAIVRK